MAGEVVAFFEVLLRGSHQNETQSNIKIHGSEQFYLGRSDSACRRYWLDPVISNRHLRVHCILYEQDPIAGIPPFVYATDLSTNGTYLKRANRECASSQGDGIRMGRNSTFLLDDGDQLRLSDSVTLVYHSITPVLGIPLTPIQQREKQLFSSRYLITGRLLGIGGFGKVMVAVHQKTQRQLACKVIDLRKLWSTLPASHGAIIRGNEKTQEHETTTAKRRWPSKMSRSFREFEILKDISHPNIIAIEKVFWSSNTIYIFQDLITGGDLFSYLEYKGGRLSDIEAAVIIRQVLTGVEYLHNRDIVHRDLKPDNIMMTSLEEGSRVVITDFGHARYLPTEKDGSPTSPSRRQRMFSHAGTLEYAAPEIHRKNETIAPDGGYSKSVDMWSIGAVAATLLSGDVVFVDRNHSRSGERYYQTVIALASKCDLSVLDDKNHMTWSKVGSRPKHFIKNLLVLDEDRRMTATEALAHRWFSNQCHAEAFNALYEKCTRDWQPRQKGSRLVESISKISAEVPKALVSGRFLSQQVVSRYFMPPQRHSNVDEDVRVPAAQGRRVNTPLPSILEEYEEGCGQRQYQLPQSYESAESGSSRPDSVQNSLEQLSLDPKDQVKYTHAKGATVYRDPRSRKGKEDVYAGPDSIYNFSIPGPPPQTPEPETKQNSIILVPETPVQNVKKRPEQSSNNRPSGFSGRRKAAYQREDSLSVQDSAVFVRRVSKRRRLNHRY